MGLEDPIEHKTYEWVDAKFVHLLQLSTYSTVMGPKVKFVWKNTETYGYNAQQLTNNNSLNEESKTKSNNFDNEDDTAPYIDTIDEDDDDKLEEKSDEISSNNKKDAINSRPELSNHELEAWIAKQVKHTNKYKRYKQYKQYKQ